MRIHGEKKKKNPSVKRRKRVTTSTAPMRSKQKVMQSAHPRVRSCSVEKPHLHLTTTPFLKVSAYNLKGQYAGMKTHL